MSRCAGPGVPPSYERGITGRVERVVLRHRYRHAFELDRHRLDKVLWRRFRKGKAQVRTERRGYT
jgi:hypothetical protein